MSLWHRDNKSIGVLVMGLFFLSALVFSIWQYWSGVDDEATRTQNLRSFYYPIEEWNEPMVYRYAATDSQISDDIWVHSWTVSDGDTLLISKSYDERHYLRAIQTDKLVSNGVIMQSLQFIQYDSMLTPIVAEAEIIYGNQYSWSDLSKDEMLLSKIRYYDPLDGSIQNTLTRNKYLDVIRQAEDGDDTIQPEVQLTIKELVESKQIGSLDIEYGGTEIYTQHIGKTYYRKDVQEGLRMEYGLESVQTLSDFEAEHGQLIDPDVSSRAGS